MNFTADQKVGEIVAAFPGASNLFKRHGIDFCCGGGRPLADALQQKRIAADGFLAQLEQAFEEEQRRRESPAIDWRTAPLSTLIERIVTIHHGYLKNEMPILSQFTQKIARVHAERHPELLELSRLFHDLMSELESHMLDEEQRLFPLIAEYESTGSRVVLTKALETLDELESEHLAAGNLLVAMREITGDYRLPPDACRSYTLTFFKLDELESDMHQHIHLENNILFERLRAHR